MFLSLNWLKNYIDPRKTDPQKIGELLTLHTAEVEGTKNPADFFKNIVVGQVLAVKKHPGADRLVVARVTDGREKFQVVCGGTNVKKNMLVALAKVDSQVFWHGEGDLVTLKAAEIRGQKSSGMICSPRELLLDRHFVCGEKEILDLTPYNLSVGQNLGEALELNDTVYEIENKTITHRADLWSHYGFARELAALLNTKFNEYSPDKLKIRPKEKTAVKVVDKKACPRYMAVKIDHVKVGPSPLWLKTALFAAGTRSINNVVDLTNFVMYDLGQPLHAFDASKLTGEQIIVRKAKDKEKITTLDEETLNLNKEDLLICDAEKSVALAGVMGGNNSEIDGQTTTIVLEAANFDAQTVRRTSLRHNLRTEASMRFEKGQDPNLPELGLLKFIDLLKEVCPEAQIASQITDIKNFTNKKRVIKLDVNYVNKKVGLSLDKKNIGRLLKPLGFTISGQWPKLNVIVPSWRAVGDVVVPDDLIEEIARMYGFNNIQPVLPKMQVNKPQPLQELRLERQIRDYLALGCGLNEALNYSFVGESQASDSGQYLALKNPINQEESRLRQSLLAGLKKNAIDNLRFFDEFGLFEVGSVYFRKPGELPADKTGRTKIPHQEKRVAGVLVGDDKSLFLRVKGIVERLFAYLGLAFKDDLVNYVMDKSLDKPAIFFEINLTALLAQAPKPKMFSALPKFPSIERDLAFVLNKKVDYQSVVAAINQCLIAELNTEFDLFDVYAGQNLEPGKKSLAFHFKFSRPDRTLAAQEADNALDKIKAGLKKNLDAQIRE
ncbi:MAG: phenylalanine--tRNA ligase subunit beta [Candidatus Portnoybacteria bacterium CG10_big_fil_rev_8_21_14_0_10_44_7]|uniref:Phenylalanine--tRNA ligase beta subunit n=1 Tax=Candidatus Portnoybacteria bacterium CG10_big_fil_rev_8_21_14_0_10_44_7 TaxID=1974816 RepID=A0A2M8KJC7_9BACT|nr:MAG: phenylalanine--tRNA ligase subunit beta [Candidatus Portnoybacteria bacterium CG10_big_fil_rev_8_21_14_0_10_44_7]